MLVQSYTITAATSSAAAVAGAVITTTQDKAPVSA